MGATSRSKASAWRVAVPLAFSVLFPLAADAAPTPVEELHALFPTVRARFTSDVRFEAVSWRSGSRAMAGFRAQVAADDEASAPNRARVRFPAVASDVYVIQGEGVRVALRPIGARAVPASPEPGALAYFGAYRDTDAWHVPGAEWTEEHLHLRRPRAPRRFDYEIVETAGVVTRGDRERPGPLPGRGRQGAPGSRSRGGGRGGSPQCARPRAGSWAALRAEPAASGSASTRPGSSIPCSSTRAGSRRGAWPSPPGMASASCCTTARCS